MLVARTTGCRSGRATAVADVDVVAVEGDVERADGERDSASLLDEPPQPRGERRAARLDPDECDPLETGAVGRSVSLDDLVSDAGEGLRDRLTVEELPRRGASGTCVVISLLSGLAGPGLKDCGGVYRARVMPPPESYSASSSSGSESASRASIASSTADSATSTLSGASSSAES